MEFHMAQLLAIAKHANAYLKKRSISSDSLDIVCRPCKRIEFLAYIDGKEKCVAKSPKEWFTALGKKGACGVRVHHQTYDDDNPLPEPIAAAFEGAEEDWAMEVLMPDEMSHFWLARWEDGRRPNVSYGLIKIAPTIPQAEPDLVGASALLQQALTEIHAFAQKHGCHPFTGHFSDALDSLARGGAEALDEACHTAWVFGGMGSWNDMGFGGVDGEAYDRVSRQLYERIQQSLIISASV